MDSSFNRQYSLYESVNNHPQGSTTSLNNLTRSTSRLGSPSVTSSVLASELGTRTGSPRTEASALGRGSATAPGWNTQTDQNQTDQSANGSGTPGASDRFGSFNAFTSPLSSGYSSFGYPYGQSNSSLMGYAGYGGGPVYGSAGQYGGQQYPSQYSQTQYGNQQYGGQYNGSQYASPYGQYANAHAAQTGGGSGGAQYAQGAYVSGLAGDQKSAGVAEGTLGQEKGASPDTCVTDENGHVSPASIFWSYIDLQGQIQGPFSGTQMNEWLAYMLDVTLIRRMGDTFFVSFGLLKEVTGSSEPFIVALTAEAWNAVMQKAAHFMNAQQEAASASAPVPGSQQDGQSSGAIAGAGVTIPQAEGVSAGSAPVTGEPELKASRSSVSSAIGDAPIADQSEPVRSRESSLAPGDNIAVALASMKVSENPQQQQQTQQQQKEQQQQVKPSEPIQSELPASAAASTSAPTKKVEIPVHESAEKREVKPARAPVVDPWKKSSRPSQVSIAELKQQELEKQQQKKKSAESPAPSSRKYQQSRWLPIEQLQQQQHSSAPQTAQQAGQSPVQTQPQQQQQQQQSLTGAGSPLSSPSTPTWSKKVITPARSLADIQKEQAIKSKQQPSSPLASVAGAVPSAAKPPVKSTIPQRTESAKGRTEETQRERPAAAVPSPVKIRSQRPSAAHQLQPPTSSVTAAASKARPTDELIHWTRVSFKDLMKGIDPMELLEVFLSLPANGSAKEFIAESIYSYSKTLDGRRFASDFLSRKKTAEESMLPGETWQDVLKRFNPNVVEQDPSFKVVTKKRTQKIARPGDSMHI